MEFEVSDLKEEQVAERNESMALAFEQQPKEGVCGPQPLLEPGAGTVAGEDWGEVVSGTAGAGVAGTAEPGAAEVRRRWMARAEREARVGAAAGVEMKFG